MRRSRRRRRQGGIKPMKLSNRKLSKMHLYGIVLVAGCALFAQPSLKLSPQEQKNLAIATRELKDMLQYGHLEIADEVMADSYIQHNPNVPNGREGAVKYFSSRGNRTPEPIKPEWKNPPTLTITSGPYVFFMWDRKAADPADPSKEYTWDHFDLVRVENGKIQEHWDEAKKNPPRSPVFTK
jgi:predicted SnoaL-like aldol condensation-catalyzing enzyme